MSENTPKPTPSQPALFGLRVVAGAWLAQLFAMGLSIGAYPVFIASLEAEFGASRTQTSMGIPLVMLIAALFSPLLGKWVDRGSPRLLMACGALMMGLGLWLISWLDTLPLIITAWVALVGLGQAMLGVIPSNTVLANWFSKRRALMVAVAGTGITVGAAIFPLVAEFLIERGGWRWALSVLSLLVVLLPVPVILYCIIKKPSYLGLNVDGKLSPVTTEQLSEAEIDIAFFSDWRYWVVGLALACMPAVLLTFNTHIVSWAEYLAFGREFGVSVLSGTAVVVALSSLLFGQICDRLGAIDTLRIALVIELIGWAIINSATNEAVFLAGVALLAIGAGSFLPCQASLLSQLWPVEAFGRATGYVGLIVITAVFVLPTAIGFGYERFDGYETPMSWIFAVLAVALLLLTRLKRGMAKASPPQSAS